MTTEMYGTVKSMDILNTTPTVLVATSAALLAPDEKTAAIVGACVGVVAWRANCDGEPASVEGVLLGLGVGAVVGVAAAVAAPAGHRKMAAIGACAGLVACVGGKNPVRTKTALAAGAGAYVGAWALSLNNTYRKAWTKRTKAGKKAWAERPTLHEQFVQSFSGLTVAQQREKNLLGTPLEGYHLVSSEQAHHYHA